MVEIDFGISEALTKIIERVADSFANYYRRLQERKNNRWDQIFFMLDEAKELTDLHMAAINEVVAPVLESNDFLTTYRRFTALVNNKDFPDQYQAVKGTLIGAYGEWPEFKKEPCRTHLRNVIGDIVSFQMAVFMRRYKDINGNLQGEDLDSFKVADAFLKVKELMDILSSQNTPVPEPDILVKENLIKNDLRILYAPEWTSRLPQGSLQDMAQVNSREDLLEFMKAWCRGWQRYIFNQLVVEGHLIYSINRLKDCKLL